jgi:hypothetical protein
VCELATPGVLPGGLHAFKFSFPKAELAHESYEGINARCRYYVRVTVSRAGYGGSLTKDVHIAVKNVGAPPAADSSVKLEVGIEDCLHIEFEYDHTRYHLSDVVTGKVNFLLVRIKIKYMEVAVIRRESSGPCACAGAAAQPAARVGGGRARPATRFPSLARSPSPYSRRGSAGERDADAL